MRPVFALAALVALAGCSASPGQHNATAAAHARSDAQKRATSVAPAPAGKKGVDDWGDYPVKQPDGSPLTAAYCGKVGDAPGSPFDNEKTCLLIACDKGDKPSCKLAESYNGNMSADDEAGISPEARTVLSSTFLICFGPDAPLNAESYSCLDTEYHRLDALLTTEYKAALARQPTEPARNRLLADERNWWRTRFEHCRDDVGDLSGSTATVVNESCEIDTLAERIVRLRHA